MGLLKNVCLLLLIIILPACSSGFGDSYISDSGTFRWSDTKSNWENSISTYEFQLHFELDGNSPIGGALSWEVFWLNHMKQVYEKVDNGDKNIRYILKRRNELGLPNITGWEQYLRNCNYPKDC